MAGVPDLGPTSDGSLSLVQSVASTTVGEPHLSPAQRHAYHYTIKHRQILGTVRDNDEAIALAFAKSPIGSLKEETLYTSLTDEYNAYMSCRSTSDSVIDDVPQDLLRAHDLQRKGLWESLYEVSKVQQMALERGASSGVVPGLEGDTTYGLEATQADAALSSIIPADQDVALITQPVKDRGGIQSSQVTSNAYAPSPSLFRSKRSVASNLQPTMPPRGRSYAIDLEDMKAKLLMLPP